MPTETNRNVKNDARACALVVYASCPTTHQTLERVDLEVGQLCQQEQDANSTHPHRHTLPRRSPSKCAKQDKPVPSG